jgi:putative DNA-invertase from lambdoid prophage Rac
MGKMRRIGLYARVSTHDQQTLPLQLATMRDYVLKRGWVIATEVEDVGSGASERPRRDELLKSARRRELDAIVVWRLDRWGRSLVDLISTLQELAALQVGFISLHEALDMTTPTGRRPSTVQQRSDEIRKLYARGISKREIAKRLGISRTSVRRLLEVTPNRP